MPLEDLITKVITDYGGTATRVQGLEDAVHELKGITADALKGINEALRSNSLILEKFNTNGEEHKTLQYQLDTAVKERDEFREEVKEDLKCLTKRIGHIEVNCAAAEHEELKDVVKDQNKIIERYERDYVLVHSATAKWLAGSVFTMILLGFMADMTYHYDMLKKFMFK